LKAHSFCSLYFIHNNNNNKKRIKSTLLLSQCLGLLLLSSIKRIIITISSALIKLKFMLLNAHQRRGKVSERERRYKIEGKKKAFRINGKICFHNINSSVHCSLTGRLFFFVCLFSLVLIRCSSFFLYNDIVVCLSPFFPPENKCSELRKNSTLFCFLTCVWV
jgi:hypothetical protein